MGTENVVFQIDNAGIYVLSCWLYFNSRKCLKINLRYCDEKKLENTEQNESHPKSKKKKLMAKN